MLLTRVVTLSAVVVPASVLAQSIDLPPGTIAAGADFPNGATVNVFEGGVVTGFPDVFSGSTFNLRGGEVNTIRALAGSTINIFVTDAAFDGVPVSGLEAGVPRLVTERNVTLVALLADANTFEWTLRPFDPGFPSPDVALTSSTVSIVLVAPECPADLNGDGLLTGADFNAFISAFVDGCG